MGCWVSAECGRDTSHVTRPSWKLSRDPDKCKPFPLAAAGPIGGRHPGPGSQSQRRVRDQTCFNKGLLLVLNWDCLSCVARYRVLQIKIIILGIKKWTKLVCRCKHKTEHMLAHSAGPGSVTKMMKPNLLKVAILWYSILFASWWWHDGTTRLHNAQNVNH